MVDKSYGYTGDRDLSRNDSVLSAERLHEITRLNFSYLTLLEAMGAASERQQRVLGLERKYVRQLMRLTSPCRMHIASCPYILFRLRLGGLARTASVYESEAAYGEMAERAAQHAFVTSALLYAWHVAKSDRLAARTTLGLSSAACLALGALPVTHLPSLAHKGRSLLVTRFVRHRRFWADLIRAAAQGSRAQLEITRIAGFQWMAMQTPD